ncbi:hypothetical protein PanWU01x14_156920, partial [Parasponia andersonii]
PLKPRVNYNKTRQNSLGIKHIQFIQIGVNSHFSGHRVILLHTSLHVLLHSPGYHPANQHGPLLAAVFRGRSGVVVGSATRRRRQDPISGDFSGGFSCDPEPVLYYATNVALLDRVAEVGGAVEAEGAHEGGAVEAEELIPIGDASGVLLGELRGLGFNGVSVLFELGYCFLGVVNFEYSVDFANWGLFFEPA